MIIYGAGLTGLIAGCLFPTAKILDQNPSPTKNHNALLRFRTTAVADALGIEFQPVTVHKGIWFNNKFVEPTPLVCNLYSKKVLSKVIDRSIWNIKPVIRYIAPPDFTEQLIDRCYGRMLFNMPLTSLIVDDMASKPAINTVPMNVLQELFPQHPSDGSPMPDFKHETIAVRHYRVKDCNVHQTIYYPDEISTIYRASITGNLMIVEYMGEVDEHFYFPRSFGLSEYEIEPIQTTKQKYGKIAPIDNAWRKKFIYTLSTERRIFSLGRYGTWRNILLDDLIKDISIIRKLINMGDYDRNLQPK